jgi:CheY-like chemotaxis protein
MMPGIDGGELARRVNASHPDVRILLITGYTGPADDVLHLSRLSKPFGQAELASALASLFADDDRIVRLHGRRSPDTV